MSSELSPSRPESARNSDSSLEELKSLVAALNAQLDQIGACGQRGNEGRHPDFLACVRRLEQERRYKSKHFPEHVSWDPAWPMLVELFRCRFEGMTVSITALAISVDVPNATGRRWIDEFERLDLAVTMPSTADARMTIVSMTDNGFRRMSDYLNRIS